MKLQTAMLCDAASVVGGKLYVHGGSWTRLTAAKFPVTRPSMAIALVTRLEATEALQKHALTVRLLRDGQEQGVTVDGTIEVGIPPGSRPGAPLFVPQAITLPLIRFEAAGVYEFVIAFDGEPHESLLCELIHKPTS